MFNSLFAVQDMLVTELDALTKNVRSLENKYVLYIYKKIQKLEKCGCKMPLGKYIDATIYIFIIIVTHQLKRIHLKS